MLEQAVRPWVNPGALVRNNIISDRTKISKERARIVWGTVGTLPVAQLVPDPSTISIQVKDDCSDDYSETSRKTHKIRVQNPDDDQQFVMVERIDSMAFSKKPRNSGTTANRSTSWVSEAAIEVEGNLQRLKDEICEATMKFANG